MKKLGIGKKDKGGDDYGDEQSRSKLFGKSKSKGTSSPSVNPYAAPTGSAVNPYAQQQGGPPDPYRASGTPSINSSYAPSTMSQQTVDSYGSRGGHAPPPYASGHGGGPGRNDASGFSNKSPVPPGGYGGSAPRYGNSGYGAQQGYGGDRFGGEGSLQPPQRSGGYGGLGRTQSNDSTQTDAARNELFGNARERVEAKQRHEQSQGIPQDERDQPGSGFNAGLSGAGGYSEYGQYNERALTAEEEEEEDVKATKDQIRFLKQQDVASTRNALRIAAQAEETGRSTLERLGQQGEAISNAERNLDLASNQNRLAEDKAKELKHLNRSMWAMKVDNPFTKQRRLKEMDDEVMRVHHEEREQRSATRAAAFDVQARQAEASRSLRDAGGQAGKRNLAERNKYQFEADSEDEAMEDEIEANIDALGGAAGRLNALGRAMGKEVEEQNKHIARIGGKADRVDDQIVMNRARLDRIH